MTLRSRSKSLFTFQQSRERKSFDDFDRIRKMSARGLIYSFLKFQLLWNNIISVKHLNILSYPSKFECNEKVNES